MKKILCLLVFSFVLLQVAVVNADSVADAEKILKTSVNGVLEVLSNKEMPMDQKKDKVIEITESVFSFPLMAKLSLGKESWTKFNSAQRDEFTNYFVELIQHIYSSKLDMFSDETVIFEPIKVIGKNKVQAPTFLVSKGKKYTVLYSMMNSDGRWKIYDVKVEGVSIVHTYRSQYNHILSTGTPDDLLKIMKEKNLENKLIAEKKTS